jgi:spore coat polysaccharide biosynthesis protein SpsF
LKTGIILQVRTGSTRLPKKMVQPFFNGKSILEILIERYTSNNQNSIPLIVATTENPDDSIINDIVSYYNVGCFRGSEDNVLLRFIEAAEEYGFDKIVRVCGDNPFFDFKGTLDLITKSENYNYTSYQVDKYPSILSHFGFWGEIVNLTTLKKVQSLTSENIYLEHVTNYIYNHPQTFSINLIDPNGGLTNRSDIRLTVDTKVDFEMGQQLYQQLIENNIPLEPQEIVKYIDSKTRFKEIMFEQINLNKK